MGAVWSARDRRLRRDVAVKLLHAWIAEDLELRRRFAREARVLAPLEHEHIVRLYDYGEDGETPFLVMELVEGANLGDVARNRMLHLGRRRAEIALPDRVRARLRACARDRPSRPHPGQRPDRACHRARRRLRLRPRADRTLDDQRHDPGHVARDTRVLVARAGPRRRQRDRHRHVRARLPALLAAVGAHPVRGRRPAGGRAAAGPRDRAVAALATCRTLRPRRPRSSTPCSRPILQTGRVRSRSVERLGAAAPSIRSAVARHDRGCRAADGCLRRAARRPQCSSRRGAIRPASAAAAAGWPSSRSGSQLPPRSPSSERRSRTPIASSRCRKVTGLTVQQARTALAEAAHVDPADAPLDDRQPLVLGVRAGRARDLAVARTRPASSAPTSTSSSASAGAPRARSCPTSRAPHGARPRPRCAAPGSPSACAPRNRGRSPRAA